MIYRFLYLAEQVLARYQGKGWGSATVAHEFKAAVSLLDGREPQRVIDMGGNVGNYTQAIITSYPNCDVVIFEPAAVNVNILNKRFKDYERVIVEPYGISNEAGSATLFSDSDGSALASLTKRNFDHSDVEFERTETVEIKVFEEYWKTELNRAHIDICKIDIEGHEFDAVTGLGEAVEHIDVIQFEMGGTNIDTRTFFRDFWIYFETHGFDVYRVTPLGLNKINEYKERHESFAQMNYLAKRRA